jgi:hypothetical protein
MKLSHLKERLAHGADVCQITQQKIVALENAPDDRKRLRQFPTVEAAMILGVSESYLRQITKDGAEFNCGTVVGNNYRRTFTLKELHWVLDGLMRKREMSDTVVDVTILKNSRSSLSQISRVALQRRRLLSILPSTLHFEAIEFFSSTSTAKPR